MRADIEQGECIRQDPAPYEPMAYHVPLDADLQQYTAEMCDLYEVPLELAYMCPECYEQFSRDNFEKGKDDEI